MAELEINNVEELKEELEKAVKDNPNKPTEEEIKAAAAEFEYASKIFPTKSWEIGEVKDARVFCDYLKHYVRNRLFWTKNGWMGVVKLDEEIQAAENLLNGKEPFQLGYQALEFVYYSLMNPGGIGFQAAQDFESESENYLPLMEAVSVSLEKARTQLKEIQFLQDKYAAMQQGFYLELEPAEPESEPGTTLVDSQNIETRKIDLSEPISGDLGDLTIHPAE
jgi:nitroreductase